MIDDPEITFAAELGRTLAKMRAELDEAAIKRIMIFVLSRYAIQPAGGDLYIQTMAEPRRPRPARQVAEPPPPAEPPPAEVPPSSANSAEPRATCPICGWQSPTNKGVNLHMYHKHGTTLKEYARQRSLDQVDSAELPELAP